MLISKTRAIQKAVSSRVNFRKKKKRCRLEFNDAREKAVHTISEIGDRRVEEEESPEPEPEKREEVLKVGGKGNGNREKRGGKGV